MPPEKSSSQRRKRESLQSRILLCAMSIQLLQLLLAALPVGSEAQWKINDVARSLAYLTLSAFAVSLVPYTNTKLKCLSAAVFGYAVADFIVCAIWYSLEFGGYFFAASMHLAGFVSAGALYLFRSYEPVHEEPEHDHVYCLRHRPNDVQSLLISMAGFFGPDGSYAIYCRGNVYRFRRGVMVCEPYQASMYVKYNSKRGNIATDHTQRSLDAMVGIKWRLFGSNCLPVLMPFWKKNNATDGSR